MRVSPAAPGRRPHQSISCAASAASRMATSSEKIEGQCNASQNMAEVSALMMAMKNSRLGGAHRAQPRGSDRGLMVGAVMHAVTGRCPRQPRISRPGGPSARRALPATTLVRFSRPALNFMGVPSSGGTVGQIDFRLRLYRTAAQCTPTLLARCLCLSLH